MNRKAGVMWKTKDVYVLIKTAQQQNRLRCEEISSQPWEVINIGLYPNGRWQFCYTFKDGRLHGKGRLWYDKGQLHREDTFHKGILHGVTRTWFPDGQIQNLIHYTNGAFDGMRREWYLNGRLKLECSYHMNLLEGTATQWHPNGMIKERMVYSEGQCHGLCTEFDINGQIISKEIYIRGVRMTGKIKRLLGSGKLSARHLVRMNNPTIRRVCLKELGYARFAASMPHEILDHREEEELIKVNWHLQEEPLYLVKVKCPTTGAFYTLRVAQDVRTVKQAIAWTFGLNEEEYQLREEG